MCSVGNVSISIKTTNTTCIRRNMAHTCCRSTIDTIVATPTTTITTTTTAAAGCVGVWVEMCEMKHGQLEYMYLTHTGKYLQKSARWSFDMVD